LGLKVREYRRAVATILPRPVDTAQAFGESRWAYLAAILLLVLGLATAALGLPAIGSGLAYDEPGLPGFGTFVIAIGGVIVVAGILQFVAAAGIWRHQDWARALGLVMAILGGIFGFIVLPTAFNPVFTTRGELGQELVNLGPNVTSILIGLGAVPYLLVVVGLLLGGRHFKRREQT
jgi:hypothetical protein